MPNTAQMLENSISNLCRQFIPVYTDLVMNVVRTPMSDEDINKAVLLAQSQYFLSIFNKLDSGFSDAIKGRIGYALNYPSNIGLPPVMKVDYLETHGISAGTIFAVLYYAIEGTAARTQVLIDVMTKLDNLQIQLMNSVWKDIIKSVQSTKASNGTQKQKYSEPKPEQPKDTFNDKVKIVYNNLKRDSVTNIYPGGISQVSRVIKSLASILEMNIDNCSAATLTKLLDIYSYVEVHSSIKGFMNHRLISELCQIYKNLIRSDEMATKAVAFWSLHHSDNMFQIISDSDIKRVETTAHLIKQEIDIVRENTDKANKVVPDNDLGTIATKPLYSTGKEVTEEYLEHLVTKEGKKLKFKHNGDTSAVGVLGRVDIYSMLTSDGVLYGTLYINNHSEYIPNFAPANYKYIVDVTHYEEPKQDSIPKAKDKLEVRFCRKCGNKLSSGVRYCNKCGTQIELGE